MVELMIHPKKQQNHQQLDDDHDQVRGHDEHHVYHDHGLNFDHQGPHYPIDPSLNNNVQFVSNPGYQNYAIDVSYN
ncbi:hypothetical protein FNV43_RR01679 [Rhamnella rubrinervis]|uniref:Uncharacterized protein n=1 Tax=Rhamnella rubrinervis TaxID=2594499 RepID=A0A8K0HQ26_9ROSA|nr:hypothetical protein FNV43_RR01679 [Rhamnella rubrinervis]